MGTRLDVATRAGRASCRDFFVGHGHLVWCAIVANLGAIDFQGWLWQVEKPEYGLIQRTLFLTWFVWLAGTSTMLTANRTIADEHVRTALPQPSDAG